MKAKVKAILNMMTVVAVMLLLSIDMDYGNGLKAAGICMLVIVVNTVVSKMLVGGTNE